MLLFFFKEGSTFLRIYDSAIEAAKRFEATESYSRLLVSKAFAEAFLGTKGNAVQLLCRAKEAEALALPSISMSQLQGKCLCYLGINHLVSGKTEDGLRNLQQALQMLRANPDQKNLALITFQILASFRQFPNATAELKGLFCYAQTGCKTGGDARLLSASSEQEEGRKLSNADQENQRSGIIFCDQPLKLAIIYIVSQTCKNFMDSETKQYFTIILHEMLNEIEREEQISTGVCKFYRLILSVLNETGDTTLHTVNRISFHKMALDQCDENSHSYQVHKEALAACYADLGATQHSLGYFNAALDSEQHALDIRLKLFGEEHAVTANSYHSLGATQHSLGNFNAALDSEQHALDIRLKLFGEEHADTANSYHNLGVTQRSLGDFKAALDSKQHALDIRLKLFGEDHPCAADSYLSLSMTQISFGDINAALNSMHRIF